MPQLEIREAAEADFWAITAIFNHVIATSTAVYIDNPVTREERIDWWRSRQAQGFPVLVAVADSTVIGFGSFGEFRSRPGYRFTVEGSIYVDAPARRKHVGTALLDALGTRARDLGKHVLVAGVDAENTASLEFLERFGFERTGHMVEVGYKFGRFLDVVFLQYWLTPRQNDREEI